MSESTHEKYLRIFADAKADDGTYPTSEFLQSVEAELDFTPTEPCKNYWPKPTKEAIMKHTNI
jgi:hypothetical protein